MRMRVAARAEMSDSELLAASQSDPDAFGELVSRHQAFVFGAAFRVVRDPNRAQDIAQEAFLRAFRSASQFRGESEVRGWLYSIARNLALNAVTRSREQPHDLVIDITDHSSPETEIMRGHDIGTVRRAVESLPEAMRSPLVLRVYGDLTYEEISEKLGIPLNTVRTRIFRAKKALERLLEVSQ
jgi:RNA polymerase sigma-70 factor (ECF subfamily)